MARSSGELWFEMGVRDKVQEALKKDIKLAEELNGNFERITKKYSELKSGRGGGHVMGKGARREVDELVKSSDKYFGVLVKINKERERLKSTKKAAMALGIDTKEIDAAIRRLNSWNATIQRFAKSYGTDSAKLRLETGSKFRERMQDIDGLIRSYNKLISIENKEAVTATQNLQRANQGLSASYDKVTQSAQKNMSTLAMLRQQAGYYFSLFGAKTLLQNVITIGGQFEYQETALKNIIGNAQQAKAIFSELKDLAIESPKTFMELTTTAKQLSAYQTPTRELFDTTKRLSDLSVGLGVDVNRLVLAFGQVRAAAVLRGQELRQFTEAGIPIVQALADKFTQMNGRLTTTADVFKLISARAVPFEMVRDVLWEMTSEGGRFYNMQAEMADTLYGKWQKLADIWQITLGDLAQTNVGGFKPFHALVDALVFAARNLQKLLPVFSAFAMSKGLRALASTKVGMFSISGLDANIAKAQKLYDLELRRKFVNGEIKEDLYRQSLALNANKTNYYMQLAAEGKIHNQTIHRLIAEKKITEEKIQQGLANGTLLQQEASQLRLLLQQDAEGKLSGWRGMMRGAGASAMNMIGGPMGAIFASAGIWTSIYASYESWVSRIEERIKSAADTAKQNAQEIGKTLETYNKLGAPQDRKDLRGRIEQMKQVLEQSNLYSDTLREQVEGAANLNTQYDILIDAMGKLKAQQEDIVHSQKEMVEAVKKTGGSDIKGFWGWAEVLATAGNPILAGADALTNTLAGSNGGIRGLFNFFFDDDINKNLEQYTEYLQEVETQMGLIAGYKSEYEAVMAEMSKDKDFALLINGKEPQEALTAIAGSKYWDEFIAKMGDSGEEFKNVVEKMVDSANDGQGELDKIAKSDIPAMLESMAKARNMELNAYIAYCKKHPEEAEKAVNRILSVLNVGGKALVGFANLLRSTLGLSPIGNGGGVSRGIYQQARMDMTEEGRQALGKLIETAKGKGWGDKNGNGVWSSVWINNFFKKGGGYLESLESIRSAWNSMAEERRAALAVGSALSAAEEAEWQRLDKAAEVFGLKEKKSKNFGGGGGKKGGGSQTDTVAKALAERVRVLKEAYSEYKKWLSVMSKDEALKKVQESGLFAPLFGGDSPVNLDDYANELRKIQSQLDMSKPEQRKVGETITSILLGMDYDSAKEEAQRAVLLMTTAMDEIAKQWDLYKNLYEKTGNREFAMNAFTKGILWDDKTRALAERLSAEYGRGDISYSMSASEAKDFFGESGKAYYDQWKKIVELIQGNYTKSLEDVASAMSSLMDEEEKIKKIEQEIADLRKQPGVTDFDARIIQKQKEIAALEQQAFEKSGDYLKFFNSILSLTIPEAEAIGQKIRENLDKNMRKGTISAKEYVRQVKLINEQMEKLRSKQGDMSALLTGGLQGLFQNKYNRSEGDFNQSVIDMQKATEDYQKAQMAGDVAGMESAKAAQASAASMQEGAAAAMEGASGAMSTVAVIDKIVHGINDTVQGIKGTFDEVKEMFDALGSDTESNGWENWNTFFDGFSKASQNATDAWDSLKNGNVGGVVKGVVGSFTSWITAFAQGHDRKLEKSIKRSIQRVKELANEYTNLQNKIERALGGIYTAGGYDDMFANYTKQLKELRGQLRDEEDKKKTDSGKVADYKQQIKEMEDSIAHFAEDMAKSLYDIDVKSWAQQLTDAVVDAWAKGEDAAQAWHDKVKDIVNDLTKNILTQKVVEMAMQPVLKYITDEMTAKSGKLDQANVIRIAQMLDEAGKSSVTTITSLLDYMKSMGYDLSDSASKEGNLSTAITSITEEAGDLLVSYVAAIRADVSVNREQLTQICAAVQSIPEMNIVAQSQLRQLEMIAANTGRNADSNDDILTIVRGFRDGLYSIKVK